MAFSPSYGRFCPVETPKASPRKILSRDGVGVDQFVDRERELAFLEMLGSLNIGPSILALFQN
ncbi:5098_t:CDS:2, partial [Paraglomus occultum]